MEREGQNKKKRRIWIPIAAVGVIAAVIAGIFGYKALNKKDLGKYDAMYKEGAILEYALGLPNYAHYTLADEDEEEKYWEHVSEIRRNLMLYGEDKALGPVKRFSGKLAAEILSKREGKNSVFSPVNIYLALGMLAEAAGGETRAEILKLTESSGIEDMRERYKNLWDILYQDDELGKCLLGSSLWLRDDSKYKKDTVKRLADTYYSATFRGKMGSEPYNEALRKWINVHTGDMLNESVSDEKMEEEVMFALVTTIWFSGDWSEMFSKGATADGTFYAADGEKTVPFMHKVEDDGDYYAGEHFGAVCKYLINGRMLFMLPDEGVSVDDLLSDPEAIRVLTDEDGDSLEWLSRLIRLSVPKYDISGATNLIETLQNLGIRNAFMPGADFSSLLKDSAYINYANHAARVKVDEEGVEGAAYTFMVESKGLPVDKEITFTLDRPFLFCVQSQDGLPLFIGVVEKP